MDDQSLHIRAVTSSDLTEDDIVIRVEETTAIRVQSNTVFTASSSNHYTGSNWDADTCCGCTRQ